jgi:hypothetical protein
MSRECVEVSARLSGGSRAFRHWHANTSTTTARSLPTNGSRPIDSDQRIEELRALKAKLRARHPERRSEAELRETSPDPE